MNEQTDKPIYLRTCPAQKDKYRYVRCAFLDHCSDKLMEWTDLKDLDPIPPKVVGTGGWLIEETDAYITLAMAIDEDEMVFGRLTIDKRNIIDKLIDCN